MIKKICIALSIITVVFLVLALVVKTNTMVPYFYDPGMRQNPLPSGPICPGISSNPTNDDYHLKPFSVGEGGPTETMCSLSPFYFLFTAIYLISFSLLLAIIYLSFIIEFYRIYIKKFDVIRQVGFWMIVAFFSMPISMVYYLLISFYFA